MSDGKPSRLRGCFTLFTFIVLGGLVAMLHSLLNETQSIRYPINLSGAQWITSLNTTITAPPHLDRFEPSRSQNIAYFRQTYAFANQPLRCWLEFSAQGDTEVYWNGQIQNKFTVDAQRFASGIVDLSADALKGPNTIAIRVHDYSKEPMARLQAVLYVLNSAGQIERYPTTPLWYANETPTFIPERQLKWTGVDFPNTHWQQAIEIQSGPPPSPLAGSELPRDIVAAEHPVAHKISFISQKPQRISIKLKNQDWQRLILLHHSNWTTELMTDQGNRLILPISKSTWNKISLEKPTASGPTELTLDYQPADNPLTVEFELWSIGHDGAAQRLSSKEMEVEYESSNTILSPAKARSIKLGKVQHWDDSLSHSMALLPTLLISALIGILLYALSCYSDRLLRITNTLSIIACSCAGFLALGLFIAKLKRVLNPNWNVSGTEHAVLLWLSAAILLALLLQAVLQRRLPQILQKIRAYPHPRVAVSVGLVLLTVIGSSLRWQDLDSYSLDQDEMSMVLTAEPIATRGIPGAELLNGFKRLTTYELLPYSIFIESLLFNDSEMGVRLHSWLFGSLMIPLLWICGRRLINPTAGWLAAVVFAFNPLSLQMAVFAFYPQQCQFFAILTVYFFYDACKTPRVQISKLLIATLFFTITYLCWEGSGFIIPGLALGLVFLRRGHWLQTLRPGFIACVVILLCVVILQRNYRVLSNLPYLRMGPGLASVSPSEMLGQAIDSQTFYYVSRFLLLENHFVLTGILIASICVAFRNRGFKFLFTIFACQFVGYSLLLDVKAARYAYIMQPMLILLACGGVSLLAQSMARAWTAKRPQTLNMRAITTTWIALPWVVLLLASSQNCLGPTHLISATGTHPGELVTEKRDMTDFRNACHYIAAHRREGDRVITIFPHLYKYYTGAICDFIIHHDWNSSVILNPNAHPPESVDRFGGVPALTNKHQVLQMIAESDTDLWFVAAPSNLFLNKLDPEIRQIIEQSCEVSFESNSATVYRLKLSTLQLEPYTPAAKLINASIL